jgi:hypothetical protein
MWLSWVNPTVVATVTRAGYRVRQVRSCFMFYVSCAICHVSCAINKFLCVILFDPSVGIPVCSFLLIYPSWSIQFCLSKFLFHFLLTSCYVQILSRFSPYPLIHSSFSFPVCPFNVAHSIPALWSLEVYKFNLFNQTMSIPLGSTKFVSPTLTIKDSQLQFLLKRHLDQINL